MKSDAQVEQVIIRALCAKGALRGFLETGYLTEDAKADLKRAPQAIQDLVDLVRDLGTKKSEENPDSP